MWSSYFYITPNKSTVNYVNHTDSFTGNLLQPNKPPDQTRCLHCEGQFVSSALREQLRAILSSAHNEDNMIRSSGQSIKSEGRVFKIMLNISNAGPHTIRLQ